MSAVPNDSTFCDWVTPNARFGSGRLQSQVSFTSDAAALARQPDISFPNWLVAILPRLRELLAMPPNWDSYGASRIRVGAVDALIDVLYSVMNPWTPPPWIVPSAHGHLQAEWHSDGIDLEVEVSGPTVIYVRYADNHDAWERVMHTDLTDLSRVIDLLTHAQQ